MQSSIRVKLVVDVLFQIYGMNHEFELELHEETVGLAWDHLILEVHRLQIYMQNEMKSNIEQ